MSTQQGTPPFEGDQGSPIFGQLLLRFADEFYLLFRLILAFVAALHGAQKAFGLWGFPVPHPERPIVTVAGWVELISALLIGLWGLHPLGSRRLGCHHGDRLLHDALPRAALAAPQGWRRSPAPLVRHVRYHRRPGQP